MIQDEQDPLLLLSSLQSSREANKQVRFQFCGLSPGIEVNDNGSTL